MKSALEKFKEGATTVVETPQRGMEPDSPVIVICPDPPFKPSFFKERNLEGLGLEMYFWSMYHHVLYIGKLKNHTSVFDVYMNMSHTLGKDWNILIVTKK